MVRQSELKEVRENFEKEKRCLESCEDSEDIYQKVFNTGLVGIAYLGVRSFIGPEVDFNAPEISNPLQFFDSLGMVVSYLCGLVGGLSYGFTYLSRKSGEKDLKIAKSKLEEFSEDYKFSRGHI